MPKLQLYTDDLTKLLSMVDIRSPDECWEWKKSKTHGYGCYSPINRRYGYYRKQVPAHRIGYELFNGMINDKKTLCCHICDNRKCCNPNHIFLGSNRDNILDAVKKRRFPGQNKTHCPKGHPLSGENLKFNTKGGRSCVACAKEYSKYYRELKKEEFKEYHKKYWEEKGTSLREQKRRYWLEIKDSPQFKQKRKEYQERTKEKKRIYDIKYREMKKLKARQRSEQEA
jgi:hypothetical protein